MKPILEAIFIVCVNEIKIEKDKKKISQIGRLTDGVEEKLVDDG